MKFLVFLLFIAAAKNPQPEVLLKAADRARGALAATQGITWKIVVVSTENSEETKLSYLVKVKGDDALAETLTPPKKAGELMLFNDRSFWFFKPNATRQPVPISPRQKLSGPAANGDIASTNYVRDYIGTVVGSEKIEDQETWKLELKAKGQNTTYDRITYWISKKDSLGVKADFLTVGGDIFKSAEFEYKNTMRVGNKSYPFVSKMTIRDAVQKKNQAVLTYQNPRLENHPDAKFNVNNLTR